MKEPKQTYLSFDEYIRLGEPEQEKLGKRAEKLGKKLGKNRIAILRLIYSNPFVSSVEMANSIGISTTAIDNNIRQMRNIFIKRIGPNNGGHWEIIMED